MLVVKWKPCSLKCLTTKYISVFLFFFNRDTYNLPFLCHQICDIKKPTVITSPTEVMKSTKLLLFQTADVILVTLILSYKRSSFPLSPRSADGVTRTQLPNHVKATKPLTEEESWPNCSRTDLLPCLAITMHTGTCGIQKWGFMQHSPEPTSVHQLLDQSTSFIELLLTADYHGYRCTFNKNLVEWKTEKTTYQWQSHRARI